MVFTWSSYLEACSEVDARLKLMSPIRKPSARAAAPRRRLRPFRNIVLKPAHTARVFDAQTEKVLPTALEPSQT